MKKGKGKFIRRNRVTIIVIILILGYYYYIMHQTQLKLDEYESVKTSLRAEIAFLEKDIDKLVDEYLYAQTDEAVEKIAREKLKMVKPDEIIYLIKDEDETGGD